MNRIHCSSVFPYVLSSTFPSIFPAALSSRLLAAFVCLLVSVSGAANAALLDKVAVIVDDDIIMESQIQQRIQTVKMNIEQQQVESPGDDVIRQQVLERMIIESLQLQMGERAGVRISDQQLNEAIGQIAAQNGLTLPQFRQALVAEGSSYVALRNNVRRDLIIKRVQQGNVNNRVQLSEQEVDSFLASEEGRMLTSPDYRVGHFAISWDGDADESEVARARQLAQELVASLRESRNFQELTQLKQYQGFPAQGGELGWRKQQDLPSIFTDEVPKLKVGEVSEPIEVEGAVHILKLLEQRGGESRMVEQTKASHILLKTSEILDDDQAREKLQTMLSQVRAGEADFAELAKEHSDDIGSAREGGDLGWVLPGQMVPEFESIMAQIKAEEYSEPFKSQYGWHILTVKERKTEDLSDRVMRNQVSNFIFKRKFDEELEAWLQKIRDEAYVDIK